MDMNAPYNTSFPNETIPPERDHDSVARTSSSQVASNNRIARDYGLPTKDDVLWSCDHRATRDFIPCILRRSASNKNQNNPGLTVSIYSLFI